MTKLIYTLIRKNMAGATGQLRAESHFRDHLGAKDLDMLQLVMDCEDEFGIFIDDEEAEAIQTVGDLEAIVREKAPLKDT